MVRMAHFKFAWSQLKSQDFKMYSRKGKLVLCSIAKLIIVACRGRHAPYHFPTNTEYGGVLSFTREGRIIAASMVCSGIPGCNQDGSLGSERERLGQFTEENFSCGQAVDVFPQLSHTVLLLSSCRFEVQLSHERL